MTLNEIPIGSIVKVISEGEDEDFEIKGKLISRTKKKGSIILEVERDYGVRYKFELSPSVYIHQCKDSSYLIKKE